ncbi:MAG TPA: hypothetical protein VIL56_10160 [Gaiellaceae bacterium]
MSAPRSVFVFRQGLFGFRRRDVVAALEEQRQQIEALSAAVESLLHEKGHTWPGDGERAAAARLDEISAKLDRLLAESDRPHAPGAADQVEQRHVYVSELGDLGEVRARRIARRGGS